MKTYRQREKQGSKVQESNKGPDETKIKVNKVWFSYTAIMNVKHASAAMQSR